MHRKITDISGKAHPLISTDRLLKIDFVRVVRIDQITCQPLKDHPLREWDMNPK